MRLAPLILLVACGSTAQVAPDPYEDTGASSAASCSRDSGRVQGRVVTFIGQALLNAQVSFEDSDSAVIDAPLDGEGYFDTDLMAGTWTIQIVNSGCADGMRLIDVLPCSDEEYILELDCGG
jgi:hypothetical protein